MKKLLVLIFLISSGCYYDYDIVSYPNHPNGHTFEIKHYDTLKIYSSFSQYSMDDAKYNALIKCQNDNKNKEACLEYSYTYEGTNGPISSENYWENVKTAYLNANKNTNEPDYTKITEWSTIGDDKIKVTKSKPKKIEKKIVKKQEPKKKRK